MKNITSMGVLILFTVSCKTSKIGNSIPYLIPDKVENMLYDQIKDESDYDYSFYLIHKDKDTYRIIILSDNKKTIHQLIVSTI
ncbi:hypothetical protein [Aquimarina megaterium]|uniref:hypothetical protein n=1 Tax=Aquimarina megaterium TaxID=1443666 RepID=UPI00047079D0|nr:hypothetical protein [Aquimarina megaterium]